MLVQWRQWGIISSRQIYRLGGRSRELITTDSEFYWDLTRKLRRIEQRSEQKQKFLSSQTLKWKPDDVLRCTAVNLQANIIY